MMISMAKTSLLQCVIFCGDRLRSEADPEKSTPKINEAVTVILKAFPQVKKY